MQFDSSDLDTSGFAKSLVDNNNLRQSADVAAPGHRHSIPTTAAAPGLSSDRKRRTKLGTVAADEALETANMSEGTGTSAITSPSCERNKPEKMESLSVSSKRRRPAAKDWSKIHQREFDKMDSIGTYMEKKEAHHKQLSTYLEKLTRSTQKNGDKLQKLTSKTPQSKAERKEDRKRLASACFASPSRQGAVAFVPTVFNPSLANFNFGEATSPGIGGKVTGSKLTPAKEEFRKSNRISVAGDAPRQFGDIDKSIDCKTDHSNGWGNPWTGHSGDASAQKKRQKRGVDVSDALNNAMEDFALVSASMEGHDASNSAVTLRSANKAANIRGGELPTASDCRGPQATVSNGGSKAIVVSSGPLTRAKTAGGLGRAAAEAEVRALPLRSQRALKKDNTGKNVGVSFSGINGQIQKAEKVTIPRAVPKLEAARPVPMVINVASSKPTSTKSSVLVKADMTKPTAVGVHSAFTAVARAPVAKSRPKFDLQESLKRKLTWKPHTGPLKPLEIAASTSTAPPQTNKPVRSKILVRRAETRDVVAAQRTQAKNNLIMQRRGLM